MTQSNRLSPIVLLVALLLVIPTASHAASKTCLSGADPAVADDLTQIPSTREAIDAACACAAFDGSAGKRHSNYLRCVSSSIQTEAAAGHLRRECKATVKKYYLNSICGESPDLHDVVCIKKTVASGKLGCSVVPTTKPDGITPDDKCASNPGRIEQVACPDFSLCIDAADSNGDLRIAPPGDTGKCNTRTVGARLRLNELNANIVNSRDRIELLVVAGGTTSGITVQQDVASATVLATLPAVDVSAGDLILVHLNPGAVDAPASETTDKSQYPSTSYPSNADAAWDFVGGTSAMTWSDHVILVKAPDGNVQDAVPFVRANLGAPPAAFLADLRSIQETGLWLPASCGGIPCTHSTTPTAESISVEWGGLGTTPIGKSIDRLSIIDSDTNADWALADSSFGAPNP